MCHCHQLPFHTHSIQYTHTSPRLSHVSFPSRAPPSDPVSLTSLTSLSTAGLTHNRLSVCPHNNGPDFPNPRMLPSSLPPTVQYTAKKCSASPTHELT